MGSVSRNRSRGYKVHPRKLPVTRHPQLSREDQPEHQLFVISMSPRTLTLAFILVASLLIAFDSGAASPMTGGGLGTDERGMEAAPRRAAEEAKDRQITEPESYNAEGRDIPWGGIGAW